MSDEVTAAPPGHSVSEDGSLHKGTPSGTAGLPLWLIQWRYSQGVGLTSREGLRLIRSEA